MRALMGSALKSTLGIAMLMLLVAAAVVVPVVPESAGAQELDDAVAQVVGGRDAGDHEFPYLAAIIFDGYQGCGGALIASDWVVSAAHCFIDESIESVIVGLGSADLHNNLQLLAVANIVTHPDYEPSPFTADTNDIALVQLAVPLDLTDPTIGLVAIRDDLQLPTADGALLVSGWGDTDPSDDFAPPVIARVAQVQAIPCGVYGSNTLRLCTADADGDGGCGGDSGGPLVDARGPIHTLVALVEGLGNAIPAGSHICGRNTVVTHQRIVPHIEWMRSVTGELFRTCNGLAVTVEVQPGVPFLGTEADDVVFGTEGNDEIDGGGGDDTICAGAGDDRIHGGTGNDFIDGAAGRDFIFGESGRDVLTAGLGIDYIWGGDGNDTLDGQGGSDRMYGGPGNDLMLGDSGADRMFGGPGNDEMRGMGGQDFMWGEAGDDLMQGNFQTDNMLGGPGDDTMFGAGGRDSLFGEAGNDALSGGNNIDFLDGGDGVDTANGGRGRDKPLTAPQVRASNGQFFDGSGCIAEAILNCQSMP